MHTITLKDACAMLRIEWNTVTEAKFCNCCIESDVLLPEANASLRRHKSSYHADTLRVDEKVVNSFATYAGVDLLCGASYTFSGCKACDFCLLVA